MGERSVKLKCRDEDHFEFGRGGMLTPMQEPALFGFRRDDFTDDSYIWVKTAAREVWVSLIFARQRGRGHFSRLVRTIEGNGFAVVVPTPMGQMQAILERWGYRPTLEPTDMGEPVEAWRKPVKPLIPAEP